MEIPTKVAEKISQKYRKKKEQHFCISKEHCSYKNYFGDKCLAPKRVIWRTCRFKSKTQGGKNGNQ